MAAFYNKVMVRVLLGRIQENYRFLAAKAPGAIPVIKADAYGHGLEAVAGALAQAGAREAAVGTVEEAVRLRPRFPGRIISLLGPVEPEEYPELAEHDVIGAAHRFDQLESMARLVEARGRPVHLALKFDTGMARLGFDETDLPGVIDFLAAEKGLRPALVMSHLAAADEPDSRDFTVEQARRFQRIVSGLRAAGIDCPASLANSAGILAHPDIVRDAPRPGLALYGGNPFHGTAWADKGAALKPAMEAVAPVLSVHDLPEGRSISYGRTFTAPRDMRVAIVAAGYADAFSRSLSNRGQVVLRGRRAPIVGRVCMQMTAVDVTRLEEVEPGDAAYLLGGEGETAVTPDELAEWWGTIGYEVMCLLGLGGRRYSDQV